MNSFWVYLSVNIPVLHSSVDMAKAATLLFLFLVWVVITAATAAEYVPPVRNYAAAPAPAVSRQQPHVLTGQKVAAGFFTSTCSTTCNPTTCSAAIHRLGDPCSDVFSASIGTPYRLTGAILNQTEAEVRAAAAALRQLRDHKSLTPTEYVVVSSCADLLADGALNLHRAIHELIFVKKDRKVVFCRLANLHAMASAPVVLGESCVSLLNRFTSNAQIKTAIEQVKNVVEISKVALAVANQYAFSD